eukprot:GHVU01022025.1.p1 GENE.GHVU01022025.1~~GHVU01022025.1.p1  ORF type:complete len:268 (+),score=30.57 GHVU01022025.1:494-1297(+)
MQRLRPAGPPPASLVVEEFLRPRGNVGSTDAAFPTDSAASSSSEDRGGASCWLTLAHCRLRRMGRVCVANAGGGGCDRGVGGSGRAAILGWKLRRSGKPVDAVPPPPPASTTTAAADGGDDIVAAGAAISRAGNFGASSGGLGERPKHRHHHDRQSKKISTLSFELCVVIPVLMSEAVEREELLSWGSMLGLTVFQCLELWPGATLPPTMLPSEGCFESSSLVGAHNDSHEQKVDAVLMAAVGMEEDVLLYRLNPGLPEPTKPVRQS